jgi:hypothetical protein
MKMEKKMEYILETENGRIIEHADITNIAEEINRIANEIIKPSEDYGFIILTPKEAVNGIKYIQMAKNIGSDEYTIETRIGDNNHFKHYQYISNNKEKVVSIFYNFINNYKIPNLQEWEDVSNFYMKQGSQNNKSNVNIKLTRDSVCLADDIEDHETNAVFYCSNDTMEIISIVNYHKYLPSIAGANHWWECILNNETIGKILGNYTKIIVNKSEVEFKDNNELYFKYHSAID